MERLTLWQQKAVQETSGSKPETKRNFWAHSVADGWPDKTPTIPASSTSRCSLFFFGCWCMVHCAARFQPCDMYSRFVWSVLPPFLLVLLFLTTLTRFISQSHGLYQKERKDQATFLTAAGIFAKSRTMITDCVLVWLPPETMERIRVLATRHF